MSVDTQTASQWAATGSDVLAEKTKNSVIHALQRHTPLQDKSVETFLQGSYANKTNIRIDSDVDVVVMSTRTFYHNLDALDPVQKEAFHRDYSNATYKASDLRRDVSGALINYYGQEYVEVKNKCLRVKKRDGYTDADVVPAFEYRLYNSYASWNRLDYIQGTALFPLNGPMIINFPKEHVRHGHVKNHLSDSYFKPTVRQLKRLKHLAIEEGVIVKNLPGYLLECLVYNVPTYKFVADDYERMLAVLKELLTADFASFTSIDNVHTLFGTDPGGFEPAIAKSSIVKLTEAFLNA